MSISLEKAIENFQESCKSFAVNYMKHHDSMPMMVVFLTQNEKNEFVTILSPQLGIIHQHEDKEVFVNAVKESIKVVKPIAIAMICEAWVVKHSKEDGPVDFSIRPSEQPSREEVVLEQLETHRNAYITMYDIIRTTSGKIELEIDEKLSNSKINKSDTGGQFSNLLKDNYDNFYKSVEESLNKFQN